MIFIFIGPDMSGKTTLARSICTINDVRTTPTYRKFSHYPTPEESVSAAEKTVAEFLAMDVKPLVTVFDRFHYPDDLIYGPATNRYAIPEDIFLRYVNGVGIKLMRLNTAYIYCYADLSVLTARYAERGDDYIVPEYLPAIVAGYLKWISDPFAANFEILKLNSGMLSPAAMVEETEKFMFQQLVKNYGGRQNRK